MLFCTQSIMWIIIDIPSDFYNFQLIFKFVNTCKVIYYDD